MTQGQLAARAGISTSYVSTLEREQGHTITNAAPRPAPEVVESLAKALGASTDEARLAAGYAPAVLADAHDLEGVRISFLDASDLTDEDKEEILKTIRRTVAGIKAEKE